MRKLYGLLLLGVCLICGCSSNVKFQDEISLNEDDLVYFEEMSPNEEYIETAEDRVLYTVKIYQLDNNDVVVYVDSNSAFFETIQYQITCDNIISDSDVNVIWTTMMGNTEDAEDDQYSFVNVSISNNGKIISERRINFVKAAMEIIIDALERNN